MFATRQLRIVNSVASALQLIFRDVSMLFESERMRVGGGSWLLGLDNIDYYRLENQDDVSS